MQNPRRLVRIATLAALCVMTVTGCHLPAWGPSSPPVADTHERALQQAHDALDRWAQAVETAGEDYLSIPLREGTQVVGDLTPDEQRALLSGALVLRGQPPVPDLSMVVPYDADLGVIVWPDGSSLPVSPLSAGQAIDRVSAPGDQTCPECEPLNIIDMSPTTTEISTSRGPATAPAWRFTLEGTSAILVGLAVIEPVDVWPTPPPWDAVNPPAGHSIERGVISTDDRHLRVGLAGARTCADTPCGEDYTAETVESDLAVVVVITVTTYGQLHGQRDGPCFLMGFARTTTVELAAPLGDRAVLEVREGLPVRIIREPTFSS